MKLLSTIAALMILVSGVFAQSPSGDPSKEALQSCLLGTSPDSWNGFLLSQDQKVRVQRIQEACKEECAVSSARKTNNSISDADGSTILSELRNILNTEQYRKWINYCKGSGSEGKE